MSVLVTGATGFVAAHVLDALLSSGYTVIGTARSEKKYTPLLEGYKERHPNAKLSYEIVPDIAADDAFNEILQKHPEIEFVLHTASPVAADEGKSLKDAYYHPALNGTLNILKAVKKYSPQVSRVVITSSFAAITRFTTEFVTYTNEDWNPIKWEDASDRLSAYLAAKTAAEKAAWKFIETEKPNFSLTTVNPPFIFGPQVFDFSAENGLNDSNLVVLGIFKVDPETASYVQERKGIFVDVRDVANFHKLALEKQDTQGQRLFLASELFTGQKLLDIANKKFPELGLAKGDPTYNAAPHEGFNIDNVLKMIGGYKFVSLEESITDTLGQYLKVTKKSTQ